MANNLHSICEEVSHSNGAQFQGNNLLQYRIQSPENDTVEVILSHFNSDTVKLEVIRQGKLFSIAHLTTMNDYTVAAVITAILLED